MIDKKIKELRILNELTLKELAKILDVTESSVSLYESGKICPSDNVKKKIASYFGVTVDYLIGHTNDPKGMVLTYRNEEEEALIQELKSLGVEYITVLKKAYKDGLTAKELKKVLDFVTQLQKKDAE